MTFIFFGLFIVLMGLVVLSSLRKPHILLKLSIHILGGIVGLWLLNLGLSILGFGIPINVSTIILVGILGFPGVLALVGLQVFGI
ncbi:pro-sigmaK processing inhibitor BofA family protein [Desulfitobacterium sp.]|uniref:pro-sigmaK processing inhibitor BofA family protein n=1 Tax=Desulfitobacterium sp. TaxID=49981 RepID=UPI002B1FB830|nr:pro-sigmaK processing inhibitor BofA family protein [Desulfitobacterium sp.]MEA4900237.1 pro-sigmaK processing inhibitor BofA family protein [Desulfitobacterium sp.]